ncbi:MAG: feruloyl-CoA synthase [Alcaligenaceae bacterium]|nr:feruloyl-CoA synthase [Alcaligenaceae bacterium]MAO50220.1 feruloyl-CoA synthase [Pusillimonas sp.]MBC42053.1 feruloyl-CoA synthase [Pusillimonas sp.]HCP79991.1 feruloyl-CoA synthase [Pusillimonas sp.]|tara:strand:- start:10627 stop:12459 length:1833 start_codon:yes stop_codon:yes gene_type:complete
MQVINSMPRLAERNIKKTVRDDGTIVLTNDQPLGEVASRIGDWLEHWAQHTPDAAFLSEKDRNGNWTSLTYKQTREKVGQLAQGLLDLGIGVHQPVVALSPANIEQGILMLATLHIGRPFTTVSTAYSWPTKDYTKISGILNKLRPAVIYASDGNMFAGAISSAGLACPVVLGENSDAVPGSLTMAEVANVRETDAVGSAFAAITSQTAAKHLLTSGSTGLPKIVINTHGMLCANQKQIQLAWPFLLDEKPKLLSWLPWSHTFGTNFNFNIMLANGGTYYFDEGRPTPELIKKTIQNMSEVQPTLFFDVPRAYDFALDILEKDLPTAQKAFENVQVGFYAGAALPTSTWNRFNRLIEETQGRRIVLSSSIGSTETGPVGTFIHWFNDSPRCVGLPVAGTTIKLIPNNNKYELRIKGPQVFPGYVDAPDLTADAFDEEHFYKIGDACKLVDPEQPDKGIAFDGRIAEDFKLTTGTWVSVGTLRLQALTALSPYARDVIVTGHEQSEIGLLIFPAEAAQQVSASELRAFITESLQQMRDANGASSSKSPMRALVLDSQPSLERGEITDKGYINQRIALGIHEHEVRQLYEATHSDANIVVLQTELSTGAQAS